MPGIRGYGFKKTFAFLNQIKEPINNIKVLREIIELMDTDIAHKMLDNWDTIERNYKLMCFDEIINSIPLSVFNEFNKLDQQKKLSFGETMLFIDKIHQMWGGV